MVKLRQRTQFTHDVVLRMYLSLSDGQTGMAHMQCLILSSLSTTGSFLSLHSCMWHSLWLMGSKEVLHDMGMAIGHP